MNTLGPYFLNPYQQNSPASAVGKFDIPIVIGTNGYVEVVNLTNFNCQVTFQSRGTAFQEARSKVLYKMTQAQQGIQMLTLQTPQYQLPNPPRYVRLSVAYQNGETGFLPVWVNTYEEGEIEPYAPVSLANPPAQSSFFASKEVHAGGTLVLPNTFTFYGTVPSNEGTCDLLGFDYTSNGSASTSSGNLTITNLNNQPDGSTSIQYHILLTASTGFVLSIRYPTPIPNFAGTQITFTAPNIGASGADLIAYYSLT